MTPRENLLSLYRRQSYQAVPVGMHFCPSLVEEFNRRYPEAKGDYLRNSEPPIASSLIQALRGTSMRSIAFPTATLPFSNRITPKASRMRSNLTAGVSRTKLHPAPIT